MTEQTIIELFGGVSGGLFVSLNKGSTWNRVDEYIDASASPYISSMTQTTDGTLYVAGSNQEGWNGNGVWYTIDFGQTWTKVPGTSNCTEIESSDADAYAWMATSSGLKKWKYGDATVTNVQLGPRRLQQYENFKRRSSCINWCWIKRNLCFNRWWCYISGKFGAASSNLVPMVLLV